MKNKIMFLVIMFILSCNMISYASERERFLQGICYWRERRNSRDRRCANK